MLASTYTYRVADDRKYHPTLFHPGQEVFVKRTGKRKCCVSGNVISTVILQGPQDHQNQYAGRIPVQFNCGCSSRSGSGEKTNNSLYHVNPNRLTPRLDNAVVVCSNTRVYRQLAMSQPKSNDVVLEIGCSYGDATKILALRAHHVIGVDVSKECIESARNKLPFIDFRVVDALVSPAQMLENIDHPVTVVFVDIGGTRVLLDVLGLIAQLQWTLSPRLIVVKSTRLHAYLQRFCSKEEQRLVEDTQEFLHAVLNDASIVPIQVC